ncbi:MAG: SDR family NAD(P)-dependent oxidoreductase [Betaproteobacteria bacterium]|nr:MAG: SDR family NAD(P)-dependent oxidoreductase [Betaproteobacteria bacterium]
MKIVVVGATSAIAQAAIRIWAGEGHTLVLFGRNNSELERIAADARVRGAVAVAVHAGEITSNAYIASAVDALAVNGGVDQALIAHGSLTDAERAAVEPDYLAREFTVNFTSACVWAQLLASTMAANEQPVTKTNRGDHSRTIAVISSVAGERGRYSNFAYGAAKAGLTAFCDGLRAKMLPRGVHIVTVKPGTVDTPMTAHMKRGALTASAESVARGIVVAMNRKTDIAYLPLIWWPIMTIVRAIPERIAKKLKW